MCEIQAVRYRQVYSSFPPYFPVIPDYSFPPCSLLQLRYVEEDASMESFMISLDNKLVTNKIVGYVLSTISDAEAR